MSVFAFYRPKRHDGTVVVSSGPTDRVQRKDVERDMANTRLDTSNDCRGATMA
jgi:hypothetical protein